MAPKCQPMPHLPAQKPWQLPSHSPRTFWSQKACQWVSVLPFPSHSVLATLVLLWLSSPDSLYPRAFVHPVCLGRSFLMAPQLTPSLPLVLFHPPSPDSFVRSCLETQHSQFLDHLFFGYFACSPEMGSTGSGSLLYPRLWQIPQDHQFPNPSLYEQYGGSLGSSAGHVLMVRACANEPVRAIDLSVISAAPEAEAEGPDVVGPE